MRHGRLRQVLDQDQVRLLKQDVRSIGSCFCLELSHLYGLLLFRNLVNLFGLLKQDFLLLNELLSSVELLGLSLEDALPASLVNQGPVELVVLKARLIRYRSSILNLLLTSQAY